MDAALAAFLSETKFCHSFAEKDYKLRDDLWSWSRENLAAICVCEEKILDGMLDEVASCVECCYPHAHHDTRLQMVKGVAAGISLEEGVTPAASRKTLGNLQYELWCGVSDSERDEWSKMYVTVIRNFVRHFGAIDPRMGTIGGNGLVSYAEASCMEDGLAKALPPHLSQVQPGMDDNGCCPDGFAYFLRCLTGAPGPFILRMFKPSRDLQVPLEYWITSVVPLTTFINLTNDLFSFRKEMLAGETYNYMSLQTRAKRQGCHASVFSSTGNSDARWTFRDTICATMDLLLDAIRSLDREFIQFHRVCLNGANSEWNSELASQVWTAFRNGYISWHINSPRYRLTSLRRTLTNDIVATE